MHIGGTSFGHLGISSRTWHSYLASSLHFSSAINSDSIVDTAIIICIKDFHEIVALPNVNT